MCVRAASSFLKVTSYLFPSPQKKTQNAWILAHSVPFCVTIRNKMSYTIFQHPDEAQFCMPAVVSFRSQPYHSLDDVSRVSNVRRFLVFNQETYFNESNSKTVVGCSFDSQTNNGIRHFSSHRETWATECTPTLWIWTILTSSSKSRFFLLVSSTLKPGSQYIQIFICWRSSTQTMENVTKGLSNMWTTRSWE